jgi:hypothetical protein
MENVLSLLLCIIHLNMCIESTLGNKRLTCHRVFLLIVKRVVISTDEDITEICMIPTEQEIKRVAFDMQSQKALEPEGLLALFYKNFGQLWGVQFLKLYNAFSELKKCSLR